MAEPVLDHSVHVNREYVTKMVSDSLPANGGHGKYSYSKNSYYQRSLANTEKNKIDEEISQKLDISKFCSTSNIIRIADLGCAAGPNTFVSVQNLIEAIVEKYHFLCPTSPLPEFQVFFNDQDTNDFNSLFITLPPDRKYFAAGVAGSFHYRLFPESSLHVVHACYSLHWLSMLPKELNDKNSPAWNKGRIHYTSAPEEVYKAYSTQFAKDFENFLNARAKELVPGGIMVILMSGISKGFPYSEIPTGMMYDLLASSLMDMAREGLITEDRVDSFNLPFYAASPDEMAELVEQNGYFSIERMELTNPVPSSEGPIDIRAWIMHLRAAAEGVFIKHFGREAIDELFERLIKKLSNYSELLNSRTNVKVQLFAVLNRK